MRWGTYEASYHNLPRVLHTLCRRNPGSYFEIKHYNLPEDPTKRVLRRAFFALAACINAFQDRRPVLCIDGTFLTGRYKGTMLIAIAADGYAAGTTPDDSYGAARAPPGPQGVARAQMARSLFASPTQEELGYSRLHDAPPRATRRSRGPGGGAR
ncbi:hypothetical protein U9M48_032531 [Paspalum notatum var. saurae]|uniref:Uncharacterized protein n=1 Tax=Paspalum notatum var. saurae TaxID=547442 RepID=A0AAQ3X5V1_PASNO